VRFWMAFIKLPSPAAGRLVLASRGGRPVRPRTGGGTSATFAIATSAVTTSTSVTITASAGDVTRLVRRLLERRQSEDLHVHAQRERHGYGQRAVTRRPLSTREEEGC